MRCAHRNGLLIGAPELAEELATACGPRDQWRDDGDDEDFGPPRAGTEVYDSLDEDDEDSPASLSPSGPLSIHSIAARAGHAKLARPKTEVGKFQGVELTSIINMIDLEQQGAKPLVDLSAPPVPRALDSGPRELANDPSLAPSRVEPPPAMGRSDTPPPLDRGQMLPVRRAATPGRGERTELATARRGGFVVKPWMVILVIVVVAGVAALVVALSGPSLPAGK